MRRTRAGSRAAFTLIELMIVVAIVAILAAIAIPNLLRSRMAANETAAIAACKAYGSAQEIYRRTDYDGDGVLEYATDITGALSLYELTAGSGDLALVDAAFAAAEGAPGNARPKSGYVFLIRGRHVPPNGGASLPYFVPAPGGGINMTLGHALSAVPASYDSSGRNCFQYSSAGVIYQLDRGPSNSSHVTAFDIKTGGTWVVAE
ncbi:MAG: DUF2950 domain-containing protein [Planctomycetota bacterium]|nr:DUF2950 domain-containing protein [Planctomycetota bacterium]